MIASGQCYIVCLHLDSVKKVAIVSMAKTAASWEQDAVQGEIWIGTCM